MVFFAYFANKDKSLTKEQKLNGVKLAIMLGLDDMVSTLSKEGLLNTAIQLVIGPYYDVTQVQKEKLLQYGFIKTVSVSQKNVLFSGNQIGPIIGDETFVCFSDFCTLDLYRRYYADVPYISTWSETETMLR